ncbi:glutaredoxin family protein [Allosalinactinospora lopnorensis]|uniref:glutaredoxin family protein n=1 Tax=Allosalinactinospora lopnorensis TaxID=1352348 RepID=UPI000623FEE2|nr:glutaredoxin family protein [Allosalinactinospora lopnorensis]
MSGADPAHRITMIGKPGCHLCDEALRIIERVAADLGVSYDVRDITEAPPEERDEYWEKIPVTFVDGKPHDFWRVSEKRLRAALT